MNPEQNNNSKVKWAIFVPIVSLLVIGIGWNFARMETLANQIDYYRIDAQNTKVMLASIQTDLVWIKTALIDLQKSVNK